MWAEGIVVTFPNWSDLSEHTKNGVSEAILFYGSTNSVGSINLTFKDVILTIGAINGVMRGGMRKSSKSFQPTSTPGPSVSVLCSRQKTSCPNYMPSYRDIGWSYYFLTLYLLNRLYEF
jgi:hypothetical protein